MIGMRIDRRQWLAATGAAAVAAVARGEEAKPAKRPKVAAIFTELKLRSHAFHIVGNLMAPHLFRGQRIDPGVDVVSFYADQFPEGDMAKDASRRFDVPLFGTIREALCLGGRELAVDAVLLIGEHGRYPTNELGQRMYPRKEFFDQILAVIERSGRPVPVFNDKHLSYRWDWAKQMYDDARRLRIPLMAGSSVPLAERRPPVEFPEGAVVEEAVSIHGGPMESYDFHGLEVLQSLIEFRKGGETGISRVELLEGEACQRAAQEGRWSRELVEAAMHAERDAKMERIRESPFPPEPFIPRHAIVLTYKDGTRASVLAIGRTGERWNFACRLKGRAEPLALAFYNGPWGNWNLFQSLCGAIASFFRTGEAPYPVERTLLATGALDAAMHSNHQRGKPIDTPHLEFAYQPKDFRAFRENGESWKVITTETPEPRTFEPGNT